MDAEVTVDWFGGTGEVSIAYRKITAKTHFFVGIDKGMHEFTCKVDQVYVFPTPVYGVIPGSAIALRLPQRTVLVAPACHRLRTEALLRVNGIEVVECSISTPWVFRWFMRQAIRGRLSRNWPPVELPAGQCAQFAEYPMMDWLIEHAAIPGGCPLADLAIAAEGLSEVGFDVSRVDCFDAIDRLVADGLIILEGASAGDVVEFGGGKHNALPDDVYAVATETGIERNLEINHARASDLIEIGREIRGTS